MATMLMIVVLVFFMCNVLALVINLLEVRSRERKTSIQIPELMNVGRWELALTPQDVPKCALGPSLGLLGYLCSMLLAIFADFRAKSS